MPITERDGYGNRRGDCDECEAVDVWLVSQDDDGEAPWVCSECYDRQNDGNYDGDEYDENGDPIDTRAAGQVEAYDFAGDHTPSPPVLLLPELENRAPRRISIEQEVGRGGTTLAQRLYDAGLCETPHKLGYHSAGSDGTGGICHVEDDGSVDAEIIYSMLRLDRPNIARTLEDALSVVRGAISEDECKLDMRCGFHVHVDIKGYGMKDVESLYHLWNHTEDTIYRIASANWSAHRSVVAEYDYSPATPKGLDSWRSIGARFENQRGALNFANYLAARGYCHCGAFAFAEWEKCECDLRKSTVEFRVFNATANLRKVHAYTALCLAMVSAAQERQYTAEEYPAFPWEGGREVRNVEATNRALSVLYSLPLTDAEKDDLRYCVGCSSANALDAVAA